VRTLLVLMLVAGIGTARHAVMRTLSGPNPAVFALRASDFPSPATVLTSRVESNKRVTREQSVTHFGAPFRTEKRITGYFMEVGRGKVKKLMVQHPVVTSYLVSRFPTPDLAAAAFGQERGGWEDSILHPQGGTKAKVVGLEEQKFGELLPRGLYVATTPTAQGPTIVSELIFKRNVYLIEVFQSYYSRDATPYGAASRPYVLSIGHKLDAIAAGNSETLPPNPPPKPQLATASPEQ
jgi:hypothetical protein